MTAISLWACAALLVGVFIYIFYLPSGAEEQHQKTRLEYLQERKEVVYEGLRDLNFDYSAGKHPEADYQAQRALLENEAAEILAEIELLGSMQQSGPTVA
jgi:hypothetical protein